MKKKINSFINIWPVNGVIATVVIVLNLFGVSNSLAQTNTWDGSSSTDWNTAANWSLNLIPTSAHDVVIPNNVAGANDNPVISANAQCLTLLLTGGGVTVSLSINPGISLTVTNGVTIGAGGAGSVDKTLAVNGGSLSCASLTIDATGADARVSSLTISTGSVTISGNITMNSPAPRNLISISSTGTLNVGGDITGGNLTTVAGSTVNYNGAGAQAVRDVNYAGNLTLSGSNTKTWSLGASRTVGGILTISSGSTLTLANNQTLGVTGTTSVTGTFNLGGTSAKTFTGDVTLNAGSTWNETAVAAVNFGGNLTNNSTTFTANTGTHTFSGTTKILSGTTTTSITDAAFTGTYTNNGTFTASTTLSGAGGLTQGATGVLNIGGTSTITTLTATAAGNTVNYTGAAQTVKAVAYGALGLSGSGAKTMTGVTTIGSDFNISGTASATAVAALTIGGNITLGSGTTFTTGAFTHNVAGNWTNDGTTLNAAGSTINLNGAAQFVGGSSSTTFNNLALTVSGNKTFSVVTTISGNLSISGTAKADLGTLTHGTNTLTLGGIDQPSGSHGSTGSIATNQNDTYFLSTSSGILNVASCSGGIWLGITSTDWNTASNWCSNSVPNASTNVIISPGGNQPIIGAAGGLCDDITINTGATLTITGSNSLTVSGNWTNNGTFTANTSTVTFNGTTSLAGTSTTTFGNVSLSSGTVTTSNDLDVNINNSLTIGAGSSFAFSGTNGDLNVGGATQVSGTFTDGAASGVDTFTGLVTVNVGGSFTTTAVTAAGNIIFQGGISNSGTFDAGGATFNTNNQTLSTGGGSSIDFANVITVTGITVTNNGTVNTANFFAADLLTGTGTWTQGATASSILNYGGSSMSITNFNASGTGNTVNYNGLNFAQTIRGGATNYYNITLSGALNKVAGASFSVKGNWTKQSILAPFDGATNNTTITFDGTVPQNISSLAGAATTFYNLTFNNTSATSPQITLNTNGVNVTNVLTMTDGNVNLNTETLTIGSSAASNGTLSHAESSTNGWVYGGTFNRYISTTNLPIGDLRGFFPIGTSTYYRPFYLGYTGVTTGGQISLSHTGVASVTTVSIADAGPPVATIVRRHDSFWDITSAGATAGGAFSLRIGGSNLGTIGTVSGTTTNLRLLTGAVAVGTHAASAGSTTDPRVNRTGLTLAQLTGNNFYVSSIDATDSPLPIELVYFKGKIEDDAVRLFWETASELNNDFFTVERLNESDVFDPIATVKGSGTVNETKTYQAFDYAPKEGRNYYRLKQTDFDGKVSYSNMVMVDFKDSGEIVNVYPNPTANETITIELKQLRPGQQVPLQIRSMIGVQTFSNTFSADSTGNINVRIQVDQWPCGLYLVQIGTDAPVQRKIVIE